MSGEYYEFESREALMDAARRAAVGSRDEIENCGDIVWVRRDGVVIWRGVNG
jgi:hypothetical protein